MIDCLSNPDWLNPQIDVLLFLQNIRINCSDMIDKLFLSITVFGEYWLPTVVCAIAYWCVDFRAGIYLFSLEGINVIISHFFKMIACVYRPWILNNNLHPSELAIPFAKGYSFPSGHSCMSSSVFGGLAYLVRKKKLLMFLLIGLILLIGFSRLWLGVHTPQDVIGGFSIGIILIFAVNNVINWAEKDKNRYLYLLAIIDILTALSLVYIAFYNTYRMDYIDGKLLVEPFKQIYITFVVNGYTLGLINGVFLCRRFFPFNPKEVSVKRRIIRGLIGAIGIIALMKTLLVYIIMHSMNLKTAFFVTFALGIIITLIYPIIFSNYRKILHKRFM